MKRTIMLSLSVLLALGMLTLGAVPAQAGGKKVVYTFSVASLGGEVVPGLPSGGGGPLFADGTAGGHFGLASDKGMLVQVAKVAIWAVVGALPDGTVLIELCIDVHTIKGDVPDTSFCAQVPVTPTPEKVDVDLDGSPDIVFRLTPAN